MDVSNDEIYDILSYYGIDCANNSISVASGWFGNANSELLNEINFDENTTCWEKYYVELKKLSSGDQLLYKKANDFGIITLEYMIFNKNEKLGILNVSENTYIPIENIRFDTDTANSADANNDKIYHIIKNITWEKYHTSADKIKKAFKNYMNAKHQI
jgi:hypothetical protein